MVVYILMNTRFLLLDDQVKSTIILPNIQISKDAKSRADIFYDDIGIKELGTHVIGSLFQWSAREESIRRLFPGWPYLPNHYGGIVEPEDFEKKSWGLYTYLT